MLMKLLNVTWNLNFFFSQIPNPLFDLAGITCGHFLVPFWTFFGATLIGKAIVKMHIQVDGVAISNTYNMTHPWSFSLPPQYTIPSS